MENQITSGMKKNRKILKQNRKKDYGRPCSLSMVRSNKLLMVRRVGKQITQVDSRGGEAEGEVVDNVSIPGKVHTIAVVIERDLVDLGENLR